MKLENIKTIGILGAGVMGGGIAQIATLAGYKVIVRDLTDEILAKSKETIINGRFGMQGGVARGKNTQEQVDQAAANLGVTTKVEDLKDCDLIIEAIGGGPSGELENKDLKLKVFAELEKVVKPDAIFATNTSRFTVADLAAVTNRLPLFVGMHFFSPVPAMKAVEVIWTKDTSEETIKTIEDLCDKLAKTHTRVKDVPGDTAFIGNRIMGAARREAMKIIEEGIATAEGVNLVMMGGFNWPAGPAPARGPNARSGWK